MAFVYNGNFSLLLFFSFFHISRDTKRKIVANVRDVLIQEIMTLSNSEFEGEAIDMDSVAFAGNCKLLRIGLNLEKMC